MTRMERLEEVAKRMSRAPPETNTKWEDSRCAPTAIGGPVGCGVLR